MTLLIPNKKNNSNVVQQIYCLTANDSRSLVKKSQPRQIKIVLFDRWL